LHAGQDVNYGGADVFRIFPSPFNTNLSRTRQSLSNADFFGIGPTIGGEIQKRWNGIEFRGEATLAALIGRAAQSGEFTEATTRVFTPGIGFIPGVIPLPSPSATSTLFLINKNPTRVVPMSELAVSASAPISDRVTLGVTGFMAVWFRAPVAPEFQISTATIQQGGTVAPNNGAWYTRSRTLLFPGVGIHIEIQL
jgi:hypothetical protein